MERVRGEILVCDLGLLQAEDVWALALKPG